MTVKNENDCGDDNLCHYDHLNGLYGRNFGAILVGLGVVTLLNLYTPLDFVVELQSITHQAARFDILLAMVVMLVALSLFCHYLILKPVSHVMKARRDKKPVGSREMALARRRLLNLPLIFASIVFLLFLNVPMMSMALFVLAYELPLRMALLILFRAIMVGMISSTTAFFLMEEYSRKRLIPLFFPEGKLAAVRGAFQISILRRIRVLYMGGTSVPMIILVFTLLFTVWGIDEKAVTAIELGREILVFTVTLCVLFILIALRLNFLVGRSILDPIGKMIHLVNRVQNGDYEQSVPVETNDELGILGDGLNEMTEGLRERERMRQSLNLAKEVQQNLLPRSQPCFEGLDIAGTSRYCDETGGDYFDFIPMPTREEEAKRLIVLVGDVSDHGISSALLMATARGALRQRSALPGDLGSMITDVNRQLCPDVERTGQFMTLFALMVDRQKMRIHFVRAGHDPLLLYDPARDIVTEIGGEGIALGLDDRFSYREEHFDDLQVGQVLFLTTDGVYETRNPEGEMFGKKRVAELLRRHGRASATEMVDTVIRTLDRFSPGVDQDDDITMVAVKITSV